jgi:hypothetical protein
VTKSLQYRTAPPLSILNAQDLQDNVHLLPKEIHLISRLVYLLGFFPYEEICKKLRTIKYIHTYLKYHSVCHFVRIRTFTPSPASECVPVPDPEPKGEGAGTLVCG